MKVWWAGSDGRADGMNVGYSPVCVFLSRAQLFHNNGLGVRFYFLAEKLRYRTYNLHLHSVTACVCKDKRIMSSSNPLQGLIPQVCIS